MSKKTKTKEITNKADAPEPTEIPETLAPVEDEVEITDAPQVDPGEPVETGLVEVSIVQNTDVEGEPEDLQGESEPETQFPEQSVEGVCEDAGRGDTSVEDLGAAESDAPESDTGHGTGIDTDDPGQDSSETRGIHRDPRIPPVGTILHRPYKGFDLKVLVTEDGFLWANRTYRSISALAKAMTGHRTINGYAFFGLGVAPGGRGSRHGTGQAARLQGRISKIEALVARLKVALEDGFSEMHRAETELAELREKISALWDSTSHAATQEDGEAS